MTKLKQKYIDILLGSFKLRGEIADAMGKDVSSVTRWVKENHVLLTTDVVKAIISGYTGDPISELTEIKENVKSI